MRKLLALLAIAVLAMSACNRGGDDENDAFDDEPFFPNVAIVDESPSPSPTATATAAPAAQGSSGSRSGSSGGSGGSGGSNGTGAAAPAAATQAPAKVTCPSGQVTAETQSMQTQGGDTFTGGNPDEYQVHIEGVVANATNSTIQNVQLRVRIAVSNADPKTTTVVVPGPIGVGGTAKWSKDTEYESAEDPDTDDVRTTVTGWTWSDSSKSVCPTAS